jgi:hypothetical protein
VKNRAAPAPAPAADDSDDIAGRTDGALDRLDPLPLDQLLARILRRAHDAAETLNSPDEARAILHVARSFADELGATNPEFDRMRFIKAATGL